VTKAKWENIVAEIRSPEYQRNVAAATPIREKRIDTPRKLQKRGRHFIQVPWAWMDRLRGASGQTYRVAWILLYLHWKSGGRPITLANGMLEIDGVSRFSKLCALRDLEQRGLITVERRPSKSPVIRLVSDLPTEWLFEG
jgi:hypothetical protein